MWAPPLSGSPVSNYVRGNFTSEDLFPAIVGERESACKLYIFFSLTRGSYLFFNFFFWLGCYVSETSCLYYNETYFTQFWNKDFWYWRLRCRTNSTECRGTTGGCGSAAFVVCSYTSLLLEAQFVLAQFVLVSLWRHLVASIQNCICSLAKYLYLCVKSKMA